MQLSRKWILMSVLAGTGVMFFSTALFAATPVRFASEDLRAFVQLVKPEQSTLIVNGRRGEFSPGASLRFAGLEPQIFDIDLNLGGNLVDLRFNNLRAKAPAVSFEGERLRVDIAFEDQVKAIRSTLGSISMKDIKLTAWIHFTTEGAPRLVYQGGTLSGELKGTGLLKPKWVITAIRNLALKSLKSLIERQLARSGVEASVGTGLVTWARFSTDERLTKVLPGTTRVSTEGLSFEAE